ncbi:lipoate--protein ligase family protein [Estrella lausannensis]|uniref:Putative lipoate-protein ligase A n=1 Tax=Estrella lausannensis TaxID=483423 RepID=A0A0H5DQ18_9BACT|nr:hypothetical protein [Estrella lausannensis]CRX37614.1 putative lipoate-protein ligase A [Estrella lausannensis]
MTCSRETHHTLHVMDSGVLPAQENMDLDFALLNGLENTPRTLIRFYQFPPASCTHGLFMKPELFFDREAVAKMDMQIAKRPTGGGLIFHTFDFTFSFLMPIDHPVFPQNVKESYRLINSHALRAVKEVFAVEPELAADGEKTGSPLGGFCLAKATVYDIMLHGKKIGGAAQRRTKSGLLHQASITLALPESDLLHALLPGHPQIVSAMLSSSCPLLKTSPPSPPSLEAARSALRKSLIASFTPLFTLS